MDPDIRQRLTPEHVAEIAGRYGTTPERMRVLDGYESFIYAVPDLDLVIRVGHSSRRTPELTHGEIDWMSFLAQHGVAVAESRPSLEGRWVELVSDGVDGEFVVAGFQHARGEQLPGDRWNAAFARRYGELLGSMHALALEYEPANPAWRRPHWNDRTAMFVPDALCIPADQPEVRRQTEAVLAEVSSLPTDILDYALIHQDAHSGNFFVDENGRLTLFDFDDCAYGWFAYDVALVFFYAAVLLSDDEAKQLIEWFAPSFFEGYGAHHRLSAEQLDWIPLFMRLREVDLYALIHRDGEQGSDHWWISGFMNGRRERIAAARPVVEYAWRKLG